MSRSPETRERSRDAIVAIEEFRAEVQHVIHNVMLDHDVSAEELAARIGRAAVTAADIEECLSDAGNPTIEFLAEIFHALGETPTLTTPSYSRHF